ncbi:type II secretion system protein [Ruficoccus amylovorans]|uniref:Type II secretion system protein n=1 Tax=Ruficoccus amylovorans TaxID=1804625 RepID=A0A842HK30_9BACT|nr:type II secretion system protein [Ruficoccus amylovorans]MBC2595906.1 type II secretion system protein [Ruficoccus amylovorans]
MRKTHTRCGAGRAFGLVELLVSIAVISVLAALLITAVSRVRMSAQITESTANMRQCFTYSMLYAQENKGVYPAAYSITTAVNTTWLNVLWAYAYPDIDFPGYGRDMEGSIFYTPLIEEGAAARTFGTNTHLSYQYREGLYNLLDDPGNIAYLGDVKTSSGLTTAQINPRNNGQVGLVFLDGHLELREAGDIPSDPADYFWRATRP